MSKRIYVTLGRYKNTEIKETSFELIGSVKESDTGPICWVKDPETSKTRKIHLDEYEIEESAEAIEIASKSVEELEREIKDKFDTMEDLYNAVFSGAIKSLMISGSPGTGKSSSIEEILSHQAKLNGYTYSTIKGVATPLYVFEHLRDNCQENHIVIFDDCDNLFYDHSSLNVLKAALDSKKHRIVTWGSTRGTESKSFEFKGSVVFLTNISFNNITKNEVLKSHLQAMASRSHYFDVSLNSNIEKFIRIKQVCKNTDILSSRSIDAEQSKDIIDFIYGNMDKFSELSLRTTSKIVDMFLYSPDKWRRLISLTCFK